MIKKKIVNFLQKYDYEFVHTKNTKSTMDDVRNHLMHYNKNCVYLSDQQSEGKGRRGNKWHSPLGNIYCSISFDNFLNLKEHFLFSLIVAISVKMSLAKLGIKDVYFKWPNDIFYKKKKFAGLISEIIKINKKNNIVVGIGINLISSPKIKEYNTTYLKYFCNIKSKDEFLLIFIKLLFVNISKMQKNRKDQLINVFSKSLMFIDERIKIVFSDASVKYGIFRGINNDGSLKLERNDKIEIIYNGSIEL